MVPFDNYSWLSLRQQDELIRRIGEIQLVNEAHKSQTPKVSGLSKFLALLANELTCLGFSLELHFSSQPDSQTTLSQQGKVSGCA